MISFRRSLRPLPAQSPALHLRHLFKPPTPQEERKGILHCQAVSVVAWHARQFHRLACETGGGKTPVTTELAVLVHWRRRGYTGYTVALFRIICILWMFIFVWFKTDWFKIMIYCLSRWWHGCVVSVVETAQRHLYPQPSIYAFTSTWNRQHVSVREGKLGWELRLVYYLGQCCHAGKKACLRHIWQCKNVERWTTDGLKPTIF